MTVIQKAHDLAEAITASNEFLTLRKAEEAMLNDDAAQEILDKYRSIQERLAENDDPDELHEEIENVEREMKNTPVIGDYLDAQDKVAAILQEVNFILGRAINGEEEESSCDSGSCGSGCCGCS